MSASILLAVSIVWRTSSTRSSNAASWKYELATFAATCSAVLALASDDERSEEHTSELQSRSDLVCRLLLEKKKRKLLCSSEHLRLSVCLIMHIKCLSAQSLEVKKPYTHLC